MKVGDRVRVVRGQDAEKIGTIVEFVTRISRVQDLKEGVDISDEGAERVWYIQLEGGEGKKEFRESDLELTD